MMSRDDDGCAQLIGATFQFAIAGLAGPRLQIASVRDRDVASRELDPKLFGQARRKIQLAAGFGSEPVVNAVGKQADPKARRQPRHDVQQGRRVAPARNREQQAITNGKPTFFAQRPLDDTQERGRV
jgi:hypothetical protein